MFACHKCPFITWQETITFHNNIRVVVLTGSLRWHFSMLIIGGNQQILAGQNWGQSWRQSTLTSHQRLYKFAAVAFGLVKGPSPTLPTHGKMDEMFPPVKWHVAHIIIHHIIIFLRSSVEQISSFLPVLYPLHSKEVHFNTMKCGCFTEKIELLLCVTWFCWIEFRVHTT